MKPFLFLEDLLKILPLCLSEDAEINILGKELLDTYDCCLFPLTMYILYDRGKLLFPILSSKSEENLKISFNLLPVITASLGCGFFSSYSISSCV